LTLVAVPMWIAWANPDYRRQLRTLTPEQPKEFGEQERIDNQM
jgi:hypothetical protein